MFGRVEVSKKSRNAYFAAAAARFAMDAKMLHCRASVHVENKDDITFWEAVLYKFLPKEKFHFISGSRNEYGHDTNGVTQCLKYLPHLSPSFIICIDSDYRYLLRARKMNVKHFVLQTYTYSFENHHCVGECLEELCRRLTNVSECPFNFALFWKRYSNALYKLFIWHLFLMANGSTMFTQSDFNQYLSLAPYYRSKFELVERPEDILKALAHRVNMRVREFESMYPDADVQTFSLKMEALGLYADNIYLYVRGHNVYDLTMDMCRCVCIKMLRKAKKPMRCLDNLDLQLKRSFCFSGYRAIEQVASDVRSLLK